MSRFRNAVVYIIVVLIALLCCSCYRANYSSTDLVDYERCIARNPYQRILFPEQMLLSEQNCVFYSLYQWDGSNTPVSLTFVHASYDVETFQKEIERLQSMDAAYSENHFSAPAYILCLNYVGSSEYALIDAEEHRIRYVFYQTSLALRKLPSEDHVLLEHSNDRIPLPYEYQWH